jgi:hypothetical protein
MMYASAKCAASPPRQDTSVELSGCDRLVVAQEYPANGMVKPGESTQPRGDRPSVHAPLDDLQRHALAHRFGLRLEIDHAAPIIADAFQLSEQNDYCRDLLFR